MADGKVWLITGASRGMGAALTRAALAAGNAVVATGRRPDKIAMLGASDGLLVVRLDVTSVSEANAAVEAAVERFGRIDVLVNNAGVSFKGYFEEMSPGQVEQQLATNLPGSDERHSGCVAGDAAAALRARDLVLVRCWARGVRVLVGLCSFEVRVGGLDGGAGIRGGTVRYPDHDRQSRLLPHRLASPESLVWPDVSIADYAERSAAQRTWWEAQDGQQSGDPDKLAKALLTIANEEPPSRRFLAGADVVALAERKIAELQEQIASHRELSTSLTFDPADNAEGDT
jgi:short chain dehydrogenase